MQKIIIVDGNYIHFKIVAFSKKDYARLFEIMEKHLFTYDQMFFELDIHKELGYKSLDDLPLVAEGEGFDLEQQSYLTLYEDNSKNEVELFRLSELDAIIGPSPFNVIYKNRDLLYRKRPSVRLFLFKYITNREIISNNFDNKISLDDFELESEKIYITNPEYKEFHLMNIKAKNQAIKFILHNKSVVSSHACELNQTNLNGSRKFALRKSTIIGNEKPAKPQSMQLKLF